MKQRNSRAFTFLEVLIVVAIVAILAAVALPNYRAHVLKSHRTDAYDKLIEIQLAEEKYRANNTAYT